MNIANKTIFCKDNLDVLRGIDSETIDMIYLDPPFNTNKNYFAPIGSAAKGAGFKDIWREDDYKEEWFRAIEAENLALYELLDFANKSQGKKSSNFCYMVYMSIRLIEMHRVLKPTGSIFLHCDGTMAHYLKLAMDCIFGAKNFKNEIIWHYPGGMKNNTQAFANQNDNIFFYTKLKAAKFNVIRSEISRDISQWKRWGKYSEDGENILFKHIPLTDTINRGRLVKQFKLHNGKDPAPEDIAWTLKGKLFDNVWSDISSVYRKKQKTGYDTQKPLELLHRIIKASTNEGDFVLDPFCGCATTCVAAEQLGRQWAGIDVSQLTYDFIRDRLKTDASATVFSDTPITYTHEPPHRSKDEKRATGFVYIIANPVFGGCYKVGISSNPESRLNQYQTGDPMRGYQLKYKFETPDYSAIEVAVHEEFENKHEWVRAELADIQKFIESYQAIPQAKIQAKTQEIA